MFVCKQKFILLLLCIIFVESTEANNKCYEEEIVDIDLKEGVFKGSPFHYCSPTNCNWNIPPKENSFIYVKLKAIKTDERYDSLDVYQTRWNGSELIKVKQASLSYDSVPLEHYRFSSSVNGGFFFNLSTNCDGFARSYTKSNHRFEISFFRRTEDNNIYHPCPQPFYFATNSTQYLPAFRLGFLQTCIFSINSTQEIRLKINRVNKTSNFGIKVYETGSFSDFYEEAHEGLLAKIEQYSTYDAFPLIITSRTKSVSILISSFDLNNSIIPYEIEFIAVKHECKCGDIHLKANTDKWNVFIFS
uniref:Uncharacterized protein n=1 Tax=Meloidogyne enterolobii TaxID=390850 RepID=A0A6V7VT05_MELEN|nr:unnamed protein product [Meloidogyne enterolobii]